MQNNPPTAFHKYELFFLNKRTRGLQCQCNINAKYLKLSRTLFFFSARSYLSLIFILEQWRNQRRDVLRISSSPLPFPKLKLIFIQRFFEFRNFSRIFSEYFSNPKICLEFFFIFFELWNCSRMTSKLFFELQTF